jgi:hypothetical protein
MTAFPNKITSVSPVSVHIHDDLVGHWSSDVNLPLVGNPSLLK